MSLLRFAWDSLNHPVGRLIHDNGSVMSSASTAAPPERVSDGSAGLLRGCRTRIELTAKHVRNGQSRRSLIATLAHLLGASLSTTGAALGFFASLQRQAEDSSGGEAMDQLRPDHVDPHVCGTHEPTNIERD
jgi:hypothetical protein